MFRASNQLLVRAKGLTQTEVLSLMLSMEGARGSFLKWIVCEGWHDRTDRTMRFSSCRFMQATSAPMFWKPIQMLYLLAQMLYSRYNTQTCSDSWILISGGLPYFCDITPPLCVHHAPILSSTNPMKYVTRQHTQQPIGGFCGYNFSWDKFKECWTGLMWRRRLRLRFFILMNLSKTEGNRPLNWRHDHWEVSWCSLPGSSF